MKISGLEILKLKCNQQPVEQAPQQKVMHSPQIDSDDDYLEAEDQPFSIPSRSSSRPKGTKRRVRWLGSEDDSSDTDGDPVTQIFVPNTQPDFDVVIDQVSVISYQYTMESHYSEAQSGPKYVEYIECIMYVMYI